MSLIDEQKLYKSFINKVLLLVRNEEKLYKSLTSVKTSLVASTAKLIDFPDKSTQLLLRHVTDGLTLWIGKEDTITPGSDGAWPIEAHEVLEISLKKDSEIYGICSSNLSVYTMGLDNE